MVTYVLREEKIDTILHFAAQTHVDNSFGNSFQFTQNNIYGTHVLLESAKKVGIKRFVHVSTDEVYGEGEHDQEPMFEDNVLEPTNPYAATKAGAEFIAKAYYRWGASIAPIRWNNVYGPHQYPEKLIPKFINQLMRGKKLTIHGTGDNTRNFLHVADVASAFEKILHAGVEGHVYNIGGTNEYSVLQVAKDLMRQALSSKFLIFEMDPEDGQQSTEFGDDRVFNDLRYTINSDKLHALGWKEEKTWEQGLKETVEWYRANSSRFGDIEHCLVAHPRAGLGQEDSSI
ncbi:unnamed protein product [Scytosiphon promiscuus]